MMITREFLDKQKREQNMLIFKLMAIEGKIPKTVLKQIPREILKK